MLHGTMDVLSWNGYYVLGPSLKSRPENGVGAPYVLFPSGAEPIVGTPWQHSNRYPRPRRVGQPRWGLGFYHANSSHRFLSYSTLTYVSMKFRGPSHAN